MLETKVDKGEASAISLALEKGDTLLILDDLKARKLSKQLGLNFTGTLGVINRAKSLGIVNYIRPFIDKLRETNFRVSNNIIEDLLKRNSE